VAYLFAMYTSLPSMYVSQSFQCWFLVAVISLVYLLAMVLYSAWTGWFGMACILYDSVLSLFFVFCSLSKSFVHHLFVYGQGLEVGTFSCIVF